MLDNLKEMLIDRNDTADNFENINIDNFTKPVPVIIY